MQHTMMTFRLHRTGVVLVVLGALLLGFLLFMAGCLVGQRRAAAVPGVALPAMAPAAKAPAVKAPAVKMPAVKMPPVPVVPGRPQAPPEPAVPAAPQAFSLRAGAFTDEAEAKALVEALAGRGLQASVAKVPTSGGAVLHMVLAGRFASRQEAAAAAVELARREGLSLIVVPARAVR